MGSTDSDSLKHSLIGAAITVSRRTERIWSVHQWPQEGAGGAPVMGIDRVTGIECPRRAHRSLNVLVHDIGHVRNPATAEPRCPLSATSQLAAGASVGTCWGCGGSSSRPSRQQVSVQSQSSSPEPVGSPTQLDVQGAAGSTVHTSVMLYNASSGGEKVTGTYRALGSKASFGAPVTENVSAPSGPIPAQGATATSRCRRASACSMPTCAGRTRPTAMPTSWTSC